ncbi:MAG: ABC transporter substrate-binding protein, partial [Acidimicrobiia bacterium]
MGPGFGGRAARLTALLTAMLLVATFTGAVGGATTRAASDKVLGTKNPAKGTPVKIGVISNGKTSSVDNSDESTVAAATAEWINEYHNGLGGRPIDLSICTDANEPSKAADCANQMIQDKVAAVVIAQDGVIESAWKPLHDVGIPVFIYGAGNPNIVADTTSTFVLAGPTATLLALPAGVAKKAKAKKVSAVIIDVPAATSFFKDPGPRLYKELG